MQRLLPLQPGIAHSYGVLSASTATDVKYNNGLEMPNKFMGTSTDAADSTHPTDNVRPNSRYECKPSTSQTATAISSDVHTSAVDMPELLQIESECDDGLDETDSIESEIYDRSNKLDDDPGIQSLMEISLPSPIPIASSNEECMFAQIDLGTIHLHRFFNISFQFVCRFHRRQCQQPTANEPDGHFTRITIAERCQMV